MAIFRRRASICQVARSIAIAALSALVSPASAYAVNYPPLYTTTRANGMGGAFIAVADDEQAIFVNPAGLAGIKGLTFNYATADVEMSWDAITTGLTGASAFSSFGPDSLNQLMGKKIFSSAQIAPNLVMPGFGFSIISNGQTQLLVQNQANPTIRLGYQVTNGIQGAFGYSLLPKRMRTRSDLRLGAATKMLWRQGGYYNLDFLQTLAFTQDPLTRLHELTGPYSIGFGVDLGAQYIHNIGKNLTLATAVSLRDIGDTTFADGRGQPIKNNLGVGFAATYRLRKIRATLAYDVQHLSQDMDFGSKSHLGLELQLPFVAIQTGLNQMSFTYGASFDVWIMRISANSYAQELGTYAGQDPERRYALRVAFKVGI